MGRRMVWVAVGVMAILGASLGAEGKSRSLALLGMTGGGESGEVGANVGPSLADRDKEGPTPPKARRWRGKLAATCSAGQIQCENGALEGTPLQFW